MIAILDGLAEVSGPAEPDTGVAKEVALFERAILQDDKRVFGEYDGLEAAMKCSVALTEHTRQEVGRGLTHCASTWQTARLSGAHFR